MRESHPSRRAFVQRSATTMMAAAAAASQLTLTANVHAGGGETLRVGLVGCGGRGTGAAEQALTADRGTRLVAMADLFQDQLDLSLSVLRGTAVGDRVDVPKDRQFTGFDAYQHVIDQVDVVLLTTTPHFRPIHLAYAVGKGVHVFMEKPVAVDATGIRAVFQACGDARAKGLSIASGFCWRYHLARRETMKRVRDGAIGPVVAIETTYNTRGVWDPRRSRDQVGSEMEYQLRNWYYYTWLSGDHIVEQAVHGLDTMAWAMGDEPPIRCWGSGGRQVRTEPKYGNIYDHFAITYEYPDDVRGYHHCRHWAGTDQQVRDYILGAHGFCDVFEAQIKGPNRWRYRGEKPNMYQHEHDEFFASIRSSQPMNNGASAAHSTLLAIMGRMAAYTGRIVTWEMALNSQENLSPAQYTWGDAPDEPVARPGVTQLV